MRNLCKKQTNKRQDIGTVEVAIYMKKKKKKKKKKEKQLYFSLCFTEPANDCLCSD